MTNQPNSPNFTCKDCRFWDWYYCDLNNEDDDGNIIAEWGACNQRNSFEAYSKDEPPCGLFQSDEAWKAGYEQAKRAYSPEQLVDGGLPDESFILLSNENLAQIDKWGIQEHSLFEWLAYTLEELGELSEAISEYTYRGGKIQDIIKEATQTATLALKIAWMAKEKLDLTQKGGGDA